jgi:pyruvate/2-oxoglutarate dehydrogenase complex dihydrolipoamide dehydrogenase (E3) component
MNPVADFSVGDGIFHDLNHLFVRDPGGLEPHGVEALAEIFRVIRMQFAREMQADFVNVTRQIAPAVHSFARAAWVNNFAHALIIQQTAEIFKFEICISAARFHLLGMNKFDYDVAIIGGGSGGYAAARTAAAAKLKTVVIEGGEDVGGLCILRGCMPTKALLYAAEVKHLAEHAETWGVSAGKVSFDFARVMARKSAQVKDFADYRAQQLNNGKFRFIRASAKFLDAHTVGLDNGKKLTAKNFVIATGSAVAPSPLPALDETGYLTSDSALVLKKLPKSLIILGGGAIACEFAQFFTRFEVKVTLLQRSRHPLKDFDSDAGMEIEKVFRREGVKIFTNTKLLGARHKGKLKTVSFAHEGKTISVSAEEILFALGRIPNTASLDLENAGVKTKDGYIVTNKKMQTSAPHIFAAGDCTGPHEIVHIAVTQGEIAAHNILRPKSPRKIDHRLLISIVFTDPQAAFVGLTEKEAQARGIKFLAASYPFNDHGKSLIMEVKDGFVKLLANPKSGEILGGACVGPVGGELIHEIVVAMSKRMTVHELVATPHYHPTLAEIWTYPAEELAGQI